MTDSAHTQPDLGCIEYEKVEPYDQLSKGIHQDCVDAGWWDEFPNRLDRFQLARILIASEIIEALEGLRKDLSDPHLPHRRMFDVELADAAIRCLDSLEAFGDHSDTKISTILQLHVKSIAADRTFRNLSRHDQLDKILERLYSWGITSCLLSIVALCEIHEIDLLTIIVEKRSYNKTRADHKKSERAKAGGKKF